MLKVEEFYHIYKKISIFLGLEFYHRELDTFLR